jgi:hypothetical protein
LAKEDLQGSPMLCKQPLDQRSLRVSHGPAPRNGALLLYKSPTRLKWPPAFQRRADQVASA